MRASEVPTRKVAELVPYARNSRTHSEDQVAQIAASIREFGFTNPVLIDGKGGIIAGHGRVLAAQSLGLDAVPVLVLDHLTETQRRAYVIADNKLALNAGWDHDMLRAELEALGEIEFDLDVLGFSEQELSGIFLDQAEGETDAQAEWTGMPEFDQQDRKAFRSITVHFKDQAKVDEFARLVGQPITDKTRYLWFPEIEIETYADKRYVFDPSPEGLEARVSAAAAAVDES